MSFASKYLELFRAKSWRKARILKGSCPRLELSFMNSIDAHAGQNLNRFVFSYYSNKKAAQKTSVISKFAWLNIANRSSGPNKAFLNNTQHQY